ncbi:MAG: hypothetical protein O2800_02860 [Planctomycetota bacterium]|nr:hypothetical protein [Planctomycetota bacterium]
MRETASILLLAILSAQPVEADRVVLRAAAGEFNGTVVSVDGNGVEFEAIGSDANSSTRRLLTWDRVLQVECSDPKHAREAARWAAPADSLWRGIQRLQRGDAALANDALSSGWTSWMDQGGPSALLAADALLRARLSLQYYDDLWMIALRVADRRMAQEKCEPLEMLADPIVSNIGLIPELPPRWADRASATIDAQSLSFLKVAHPVVEAIRLRVQWLAKRAFTTEDVPPFKAADRARVPKELSSGATDSIEILNLWIAGLSQQKSDREKSRDRLESSHYPLAWQRAWAHIAMAESLQCEKSSAANDAAILALLAAAETAREDHPALAARAAGWASEALIESGDSVGAKRVQDAYAADSQEGLSP